MLISKNGLIARLVQTLRSSATFPRGLGGMGVRKSARKGVALLLMASLVAGTVPARGDGMMDGGMGGDYGGYDPGYGGGGYDPIDWGGLGQLLDPLINPGYDPDPGPIYVPEEPYDPGYGGGYTPPSYNPGYSPPSYNPPTYTPPTPPRNALPGPSRQQSPTPPSNRRMPKPQRPVNTSGYRVLPEGARPTTPAQPQVNSVPAAPARPGKNDPATPAVHPLTQKEIDKISQLNDKQTNQLKTVVQHNRLTGDSVKSTVDGLLPKLPQGDKDAVTKAIEEGKPEDVKKSLEGKGVDPKTADALGAMAAVNQKVDELTKAGDLSQQQLQAANQAINDLKGQVNGLTTAINQQQQQIAAQNQQIQNLTNAVNQQQQQIAQQQQQIAQQTQQIQQLANGLNAARVQINNLTQAVNGLIRAQLLSAILQRANPGVRQVPQGPTVIVRVPGMLPPGAVAPMGNSAVLAGPPMGQRGPQPPYAGPTSITTGSVLEAMGMPQAIGPAVKDSSAGVTSGIVLINEADAPVGFMVDSKSYSLEPSYYQTFRGASSGTVSFDRGTGETAKYQVTSGSYEFTATEKGWELYRKTYKATIDNTRNPSDFQFVQGTEIRLIPAGESKELTGAYPIAIRFDDGSGNVKEKRLLDGTYAVAASGEEGLLDLFDPKNLAESEPASVSALPPDHELAQLIEEAAPEGDRGSLEALSGVSQEVREQAVSLSTKRARKNDSEGGSKIPPLLLAH